MHMIDLDPVRKHQCLLREVPLDFSAQGPFPCTAKHHVKNEGRRGDDDQKDGQQFEEDAVLQVSSTVLPGSLESCIDQARSVAGCP